ncbi:hypothetical protein LZ009_21890 [Ramlibacter sp. XY19]|uniref:hypothetical protein n=1 Tax=Ramlibacter paludis TaxID=2908000 RepID=UPI0023DB6F8E|nr:hypothetical protein [Ramlibacter paludis]MCG2595438.1 hypothetical protein [Ramlibacter paludis]
MRAAFALVVACVATMAHAEAPSFEVAYRAWDLVTELARTQRNPAISGECGKSFRPFVIPGLKRQSKEDEAVAAKACYDAARAACANPAFQRTPEFARKCEEFRQP